MDEKCVFAFRNGVMPPLSSLGRGYDNISFTYVFEIVVPARCVQKHQHLCTIFLLSHSFVPFPFQRETDAIYIVHTGKSSDSWVNGGPLGPDLHTALSGWPHRIVVLSGSLQSNSTFFTTTIRCTTHSLTHLPIQKSVNS